jgi:hypothetical protein
MARKKSRKKSKRKSPKRVAAGKKAARTRARKKGKRRAKKRRGGKGQIPLDVLEKRQRRLTRIVKKRGGFVEGDV